MVERDELPVPPQGKSRRIGKKRRAAENALSYSCRQSNNYTKPRVDLLVPSIFSLLDSRFSIFEVGANWCALATPNVFRAPLKITILDGERPFPRLGVFPQFFVSPWMCITLASLRKATQNGRNSRSRLESLFLEVRAP